MLNLTELKMWRKCLCQLEKKKPHKKTQTKTNPQKTQHRIFSSGVKI